MSELAPKPLDLGLPWKFDADKPLSDSNGLTRMGKVFQSVSTDPFLSRFDRTHYAGLSEFFSQLNSDIKATWDFFYEGNLVNPSSYIPDILGMLLKTDKRRVNPYSTLFPGAKQKDFGKVVYEGPLRRKVPGMKLTYVQTPLTILHELGFIAELPKSEPADFLHERIIAIGRTAEEIAETALEECIEPTPQHIGIRDNSIGEHASYSEEGTYARLYSPLLGPGYSAQLKLNNDGMIKVGLGFDDMPKNTNSTMKPIHQAIVATAKNP